MRPKPPSGLKYKHGKNDTNGNLPNLRGRSERSRHFSILLLSWMESPPDFYGTNSSRMVTRTVYRKSFTSVITVVNSTNVLSWYNITLSRTVNLVGSRPQNLSVCYIVTNITIFV